MDGITDMKIKGARILPRNNRPFLSGIVSVLWGEGKEQGDQEAVKRSFNNGLKETAAAVPPRA